MANHGRRDFPLVRQMFLDAIAGGVSIVDSAELIDVPMRTVYSWRYKDAEFAKEWDDAEYVGARVLEAEAMRRASQGVKKPVFYLGKKCGEIVEYSDVLLIFLLKARDPHKYCERTRAFALERKAKELDAGQNDGSIIAAQSAIEALDRLAADKQALGAKPEPTQH